MLMKKKKENPSVKNVEMRKSAVAIWGKDKATGQFSQWWKKVLGPLSTVTWNGNSVTELCGSGITEKKKKKRWQVKNEDWWLTLFQECLCLCSEVSVENGFQSNGTVFKSLAMYCLHTPQNSPVTNYLDTVFNINTGLRKYGEDRTLTPVFWLDPLSVTLQYSFPMFNMNSRSLTQCLTCATFWVRCWRNKDKQENGSIIRELIVSLSQINYSILFYSVTTVNTAFYDYGDIVLNKTR